MSVAVNIAYRGIVGNVTSFRLLEWDGDIADRSRCRQQAGGRWLVGRSYLVGSITSERMFVYKKGTAGGEGSGVQFHAVTIHIEGLPLGVAHQRTPADGHLAVGCSHGHHTAVEPFALQLAVVIVRLGCCAYSSQR